MAATNDFLRPARTKGFPRARVAPVERGVLRGGSAVSLTGPLGPATWFSVSLEAAPVRGARIDDEDLVFHSSACQTELATISALARSGAAS